MIETFNISTFSEGDIFKVYYGEEYAELTLARVRQGKFEVPNAFRQPFSLIFKGSKSIVYTQGQYKMVQEKVGEFDLFIAPIVAPGGDQEWLYYEAALC